MQRKVKKAKDENQNKAKQDKKTNPDKNKCKVMPRAAKVGTKLKKQQTVQTCQEKKKAK